MQFVDELSIDETNKNFITFAPNPTTGLIKFNSTIIEFSLYSMDGKMLYKSDSNIDQINLDFLDNGVYIIQYTTENNVKSSNTLIKH